MRNTISLSFILLWFCTYPSDAASTTAIQSQTLTPVLIHKTINPILRLEIDSEESQTQFKQIKVSFAGCDNLSDIQTAALYFTGNSDQFDNTKVMDQTNTISHSITFSAEMPLHKGTNYFWVTVNLSPTANLLHYIDASVAMIQTTTGDVNVTDITPQVRQRIGIALRQHMDDDVHTYRIPALTTTKKGTLLAVYDMRRRHGRDLQEDIDIGLSRSSDGGQTWEPVKVIMDMGEYNGLPQEQNGVSDPGIVVDQKSGYIFCAAVWMWGKPGKHQWSEDGSEPGFEIGKSAQFMMVESRNDGKNWSKPKNLTRKLKQEEWWLYAPSPQAGITLQDGTVVLPSQGRDKNGDPFSTIMYTRDRGRSWTVGNPALVGTSECQGVQLADGSIMLNMRTERPTLFRSVVTSRDLGKTWTVHPTHQKTLIEPSCNGSLLRFDYRDGNNNKSVLVFANPHSQTSRSMHTLKISFDEGKTWPKENHYLMDAGRGFGYPSLTQIDGEHLGILYEGSGSHLQFQKFTLQELIDR